MASDVPRWSPGTVVRATLAVVAGAALTAGCGSDSGTPTGSGPINSKSINSKSNNSSQNSPSKEVSGVAETVKKDLVVTRVFDAPVGRVWSAWTSSEHVMRWWGPKGFTSPVADMDVRVGGTSLVAMRTPDGRDLYNTWTYREVVPNERLEFVMGFADQNGNKVEPQSLGLPPGIPTDVPHVLTFEPTGAGGTALTVTEFGYPSDELVNLSKVGLEESLDKLAASLT